MVLSYLVSGVAALLAAACYGELCVEYPVSGGAFSYIMITFGELAAFTTLAGLILEYVVGMAAVARGFSKYLALLCNLDSTIFTLEINNNTYFFDFMAGGIVMLMSVLLSLGVRESSFFVSSERRGSRTCVRVPTQLAPPAGQPASQPASKKASLAPSCPSPCPHPCRCDRRQAAAAGICEHCGVHTRRMGQHDAVPGHQLWRGWHLPGGSLHLLRVYRL